MSIAWLVLARNLIIWKRHTITGEHNETNNAKKYLSNDPNY